jgi:sulfate/thiosulfate transport system permease protein
MLLLPIAALLTKSISVGPAEFWRIATSSVALSAYDVTFTTRQFKSEVQQVLMAENKILRKAFDSQGIF